MQREEVAFSLHCAGGHAPSKHTPAVSMRLTSGQLWFRKAHASKCTCRLLLDGFKS